MLPFCFSSLSVQNCYFLICNNLCYMVTLWHFEQWLWINVVFHLLMSYSLCHNTLTTFFIYTVFTGLCDKLRDSLFWRPFPQCSFVHSSLKVPLRSGPLQHRHSFLFSVVLLETRFCVWDHCPVSWPSLGRALAVAQTASHLTPEDGRYCQELKH